MRYISTRGQSEPRDFSGVLLAGLADDGGLFMPEAWPERSAAEWRALRDLPYADLAATVIHPFVGDTLSLETLKGLCAKAYAGFDHPARVPLVQLDDGLWVQELFHGPTLAFKDMALQLLGLLFEHVLAERDETMTIVGATSGDTGSAAIEACRDRARIKIAILHPEGRTSAVQRRQMTTVHSANVYNIAVDGTFDDCQDMVKGLFADTKFRREMRLSAVNSINWARIAAQIPYYVAAALALGAPDREVAFAVPTGNFGNVLAAWAARRMGLPISRLVIGSNRNDILTRFLAANDMTARGVEPSLSPSMDIQVSSNFERLLFELMDRDAPATAALMQDFRRTGRMPVPDAAWKKATGLFQGLAARRCGDRSRHPPHPRDDRIPRRPAYRDRDRGRADRGHGPPVVAMATAHPAKFPDAVERATGIRPSLPPRLAHLMSGTERFARAPNDLAAVETLLRAFVNRNDTHFNNPWGTAA